jgi:enhanced filamentous growth protein 1
MNQNPPYMDMHAGSHMSSAPSYSHPASAPMHHYPQYQQPPVMQPGSHYAPPQYSNYGYANGVTSPQSATGPMGPGGFQSQNIQLPGKSKSRFSRYLTDRTPAMNTNPSPQHTYGASSAAPTQTYPQAHQPFDTTGQVAPPGMKPRVTATLWEDEGSLCFQVEAKGVCVARREGTVLNSSPFQTSIC